MKKKVLSLVIASLTLLSLVGCSQTDPKVNPDKPDNIKVATTIDYDVDDLLVKCGLEGKDEFSSDGNTWYYSLSSHEPDENNEYSYSRLAIFDKENEYVGYEFYIYENEKEAKKALADHAKNRYDTDDDNYIVGDDYVGGWEKGIMDASIRTFEYRSGNMIIECTDEAIGYEFASAEDYENWATEYEKNAEQREIDIEKTHKTIMSNW